MSDNDWEVRRATVDDAAMLAEMGARTFADTFAADNSEADMEAYLADAFGPAIQAAQLRDPANVFLIAYVDGSPAAYARLRFGPPPACVPGTAPVEIVRFYAEREWIGRGVGRRLMRAALQLAEDRGCDVVWLDVWERNPRAIAFYEKCGFAVVGTAEFVLGDDVQHDLLMARSARRG